MASLAIDFAADHVDGRPLRWTPVTVKLFMTGWIPRKIMAEKAVLERIPIVLDAWTRFAGRKTGKPEWALDQTREAIPQSREEMVRRSADPGAAGPAKAFLASAKAAGVNLTDPKALDAFIARWNAQTEDS